MADVADLALILFLPWIAILGVLYWFYPRSLEKTAARRRFDVTALALALPPARCQCHGNFVGRTNPGQQPGA